jgi:hypothetical protein
MRAPWDEAKALQNRCWTMPSGSWHAPPTRKIRRLPDRVYEDNCLFCPACHAEDVRPEDRLRTLAIEASRGCRTV